MKKFGIGLLVVILLVLGGIGTGIWLKDNSNLNNIQPNSNIENKENINETNNNTENEIEETKSQAELILEKMTLEEKVGQMFIVRCPEEDAINKVSEYKIGGYILFGRDFEGETKTSLTKTIENYQNEAKIPLLIGVDEEGGTVNRVSKYKAFRNTPFKSPQELYKEGGMDLIISDTEEKCELLKSLGINVNFAPVCDISTNSKDYMYKRSFGKNAEKTAEYVENVVSTMKENKVASVLKHFPGYGNNVDTHTGISYDKREYNQFVSSDFIPFESGIEAGADIVLVSHNIVECMDEKYPASLSEKVHKILREELNFDGIIITDDLYMDAIKEFSNDEAAILAVQAGNDLLCCTDFEVQIPAVINAVKDGKISEERINESVLRILNLKINLGIL